MLTTAKCCAMEVKPRYNLTVTQKVILQQAETLLNADDNFKRACIGTITRSSGVSLRMIDWLVTNYSKRLGLRIKNNQGQYVIVHDAYRRALSAYRRRNFDPFCRATRRLPTGQKIKVDVHITGGNLKNGNIVTCVSQLNFMLWAYQTGVLQYALRESKAIEADMNAIAAASRKRRKLGCRARRAELSHAPAASCHAYAGTKAFNLS